MNVDPICSTTQDQGYIVLKSSASILVVKIKQPQRKAAEKLTSQDFTQVLHFYPEQLFITPKGNIEKQYK